MKKRIHVNMHHIRYNKKHGTNKPVITVKTSKSNDYGHEVEVLGCGTFNHKPRKGLRKDGTPYLKQYKWRCTFRDAYYVCLLIWPWSHTKLPKMQKIIKHYADKKIMNDNIVDLLEYKKMMNLE